MKTWSLLRGVLAAWALLGSQAPAQQKPDDTLARAREMNGRLMEVVEQKDETIAQQQALIENYKNGTADLIRQAFPDAPSLEYGEDGTIDTASAQALYDFLLKQKNQSPENEIFLNKKIILLIIWLHLVLDVLLVLVSLKVWRTKWHDEMVNEIVHWEFWKQKIEIMKFQMNALKDIGLKRITHLEVDTNWNVTKLYVDENVEEIDASDFPGLQELVCHGARRIYWLYQYSGLRLLSAQNLTTGAPLSAFQDARWDGMLFIKDSNWEIKKINDLLIESELDRLWSFEYVGGRVRRLSSSVESNPEPEPEPIPEPEPEQEPTPEPTPEPEPIPEPEPESNPEPIPTIPEPEPIPEPVPEPTPEPEPIPEPEPVPEEPEPEPELDPTEQHEIIREITEASEIKEALQNLTPSTCYILITSDRETGYFYTDNDINPSNTQVWIQWEKVNCDFSEFDTQIDTLIMVTWDRFPTVNHYPQKRSSERTIDPEEWFRTQFSIHPQVGEEYLCITGGGSVCVVDIVTTPTGIGYKVSEKSPRWNHSTDTIFSGFNENGSLWNSRGIQTSQVKLIHRISTPDLATHPERAMVWIQWDTACREALRSLQSNTCYIIESQPKESGESEISYMYVNKHNTVKVWWKDITGEELQAALDENILTQIRMITPSDDQTLSPKTITPQKGEMYFVRTGNSAYMFEVVEQDDKLRYIMSASSPNYLPEEIRERAFDLFTIPDSSGRTILKSGEWDTSRSTSPIVQMVKIM